MNEDKIIDLTIFTDGRMWCQIIPAGEGKSCEITEAADKQHQLWRLKKAVERLEREIKKMEGEQ